ncbi:hypothetical protein AB0B31_11330 [Catellatospora citrea]|uniref:hypothetical protein n=1 Tax=Catellatospora citrea TaxID=53366 RepID=UPI0033FDFF68
MTPELSPAGQIGNVAQIGGRVGDFSQHSQITTGVDLDKAASWLASVSAAVAGLKPPATPEWAKVQPGTAELDTELHAASRRQPGWMAR